MVKEWRDFIKSDPAVMMGKPVITGTRVTVELILEKLAAGETVEQIIVEHRRLTKEGGLCRTCFRIRGIASRYSVPYIRGEISQRESQENIF